MTLFSQAQREQLLKNGLDPDNDHKPVVKLFLTNTACTWLLSELFADQPGMAFGLCDLGMGFPELGFCYLAEILDAANQRMGITLMQDEAFEGVYPMSAYQAAARDEQRIITDVGVIARHLKPLEP